MNDKEFIQYYVDKLKTELKNFPNDFLPECEVRTISLPGKNILLGSELFGSFEIIDTAGNLVLTADDYSEAKYLLYTNRLHPLEVNLPEDESIREKCVKNYEKYLDRIVNDIMDTYDTKVENGKDKMKIANNVFNQLNLRRY
ncbi:MAG: hypothetical protein SCALA702_10980 [Melioribacteraceae bacterium]|nr:MAG: hypothetical protein SCALA702_10980 [Melioribacteraceae bacterium]